MGLCLGLQCMVIEVARDLAGLEGADSSEFNPGTEHPVIATMAEQVAIVSGDGDLGGSMRLGSYPAILAEGSQVAKRYGTTEVAERHRHRYEVNNGYRDKLEAAGLVISGTSPDGRLVEFVELGSELHPYFVATQAHPELKSRPTDPHPLFAGLIEAALERKLSSRLPMDSVVTDTPAPDDHGPLSELPILDDLALVDDPQAWPVVGSDELATGRKTAYKSDQVRTPDGELINREYLQHPGAVGVIALDDHDRIVLVRQYRHPVRHRLIEPPAGLLDNGDEDYLVGAQRELAEEVGLAARDWRVLVDLFTSPGISSESLRVYLARDLAAAPLPDGFVPHAEEAHMDVVRASLDDLVQAVLEGRLHNPTLVAGVLAAWAARTRDGFDDLRPADAPWPAREASRT